MLYMRFVFCLSIGLVGLCMVLKTIMDSPLADWDILAELRYVFHGPFLRRNYYTRFTDTVFIEPPKLSTRLNYQTRSQVLSLRN